MPYQPRSAWLELRIGLGLGLRVAVSLPACGGRASSTTRSGSSDASAGSDRHGVVPATRRGSGTNGPLAPLQCRSSSDCAPAYDCLEPGGTPLPGICPPAFSNCKLDSDCQADGGASICEPVVGCENTQHCAAGCATDGACNAGQWCRQFRCVQRSCTKDADCPPDFACSADECQRRACASDSECSAYCVLGACYSVPGACQEGHF